MDLNPMHQFEVYKIGPEINIGGLDLSFTNASLFMFISSTLILIMLFFDVNAIGIKKTKLIKPKVIKGLLMISFIIN